MTKWQTRQALYLLGLTGILYLFSCKSQDSTGRQNFSYIITQIAEIMLRICILSCVFSKNVQDVVGIYTHLVSV